MTAIRLSRYIGAFMVAMASVLVTTPTAAQSIALVTDVSGKVTGPGVVTILSEIVADTRLRLDADAKLVAIYLKSGEEYTFTGPAQIQFRAAEPQVIQGAKAQRQVSPLGKGGNVKLKPMGVAQAGYVMRGRRSTARIKLLTLSDTKSLETSPEFRWQAIEPGLKYRFELMDDAGRSLTGLDLEATSLRLPASVALSEGASYTWEVSAKSRDNRRYVNVGDFTIASPQLREEAIALRPATGASVSARVIYAAWLVQMELRDEARKYWESLAAERPDDPQLKALATE